MECKQALIIGSDGKFCEENKTIRNQTLKLGLRCGACNFHLLKAGVPLV